jgi:AraC family transcriptional regulator
MEQQLERQLTLPRMSVHLATVHWGKLEEVRPQFDGYNLCQRLSSDHAPLRIGNLPAREAFPRVRSVAFLPPGCPVQLYPMSKPMRVLNCVFDKAWFEETTGIGPDLWERHTRALIEIRNRRLEVLMQEILAELEHPGFGHELLIESAAAMILVEMARHAHRLVAEEGCAPGGQGLAPWQMRRIQERIAESVEAGYPGLAELAQLCGISQSHLMRTFKASTGWPIHKYINEERLRAAKQLLASEQLNAKEISARLGFRNPAYFATAFRRMTGKTPTEYRREARAAVSG